MANQIALVTGATAGIGYATCVKLSTLHFDIIATGRRQERLDELKKVVEANGAKFTGLCFDVRDKESCVKFLEPIERIDVLVNNAGLAKGLQHIDKNELDDIDTVIDTNVKGFLYVMQIVSRKMVAAHHGHIISVGSIAGTEPYENGAVYCGSKHAVHGITSAMRADLLSANVKVSEVRPGMVETEFSEVRLGDKDKASMFHVLYVYFIVL